jgi:hypothetical protein
VDHLHPERALSEMPLIVHHRLFERERQTEALTNRKRQTEALGN